MLNTLVAGGAGTRPRSPIWPPGNCAANCPSCRPRWTGRFGPHDAPLVGEVLSLLDYLDESIERLSNGIDRVIAPFAERARSAHTTPGIDRRGRSDDRRDRRGHDQVPDRRALGVMGGQLSRVSTSQPAKPATAPPARQQRLQRHLAMSAMGASRTKASYLSAQYHRLAGHEKTHARKAVGHTCSSGSGTSSTTTSTGMISAPTTSTAARAPQRRAQRKLTELRSLGWTVTTNPDGTKTLTPAA